MGEAQSAAEVTAALWTMQQFSRQWLKWSCAFDVLLTPTVGVPPMPIGAYKLSTMQRQGLKLLTSLPAGAGAETECCCPPPTTTASACSLAPMSAAYRTSISL